MDLLTLIANSVAALANLYIAMRLLTFRRRGRRYRRGVSVLAYCLFNASAFLAFWLVVCGFSHYAVAVPFAALCVYVDVLLWRHKGNLGEMF